MESDASLNKGFRIRSLEVTDQVLGDGSYGVVKAALCNGKECVVKQIRLHIQTSQQEKSIKARENFLKEIDTLGSLKHPSIVQFLGTYWQDDVLPLLVMEKMWLNLFKFVMRTPDRTPHLMARILYDVACGLSYLHDQDVIHRDLKADNILLTENLEAKIGDLGVAKVMADFGEGQQLTKSPGNVVHTPPEALDQNPTYTTKLDIFSFGCVVIYSIVGKVPVPALAAFRALDGGQYVRVEEVTRRQEYLQEMNHVACLKTLAMDCLSNDPDKRPTADDLLHILMEAVDELKTADEDLQSESKESLLLKINEYRTKPAQDDVTRCRACSWLLIALLLVLFVLYFAHWVENCRECGNCPRIKQQCGVLLGAINATKNFYMNVSGHIEL